MGISLSLATRLLQLSAGKIIAASKIKYPLVDEMIRDGIITDTRSGRTKSSLSITDQTALRAWLLNHFSISSLEEYIAALQSEELTRSALVLTAANSKVRQVRTFKGFLVNSYAPVSGKLNQMPFIVNPAPGTFQFIHDYETFIPDPAVTVVGVENAENFSQISKQQSLFQRLQPLFVSRYPQNQSKDLQKWLQRIPNNYLHFGDLDFAGIGIYLHEYKRHLGTRASFFIPINLELLLVRFGSKNLYDRQKINYRVENIDEPEITGLIKLLHKHKKGLEQEALIGI